MAGNSGENNPNWGGGRTISSHGYVLIRVGIGHPLADVRGYAYEHRLIAEQKIGRKLRYGEKVHHIDGNKQNNAPENLEVCSSLAHHKLKHREKQLNRRLPGEGNPLIPCACGCGTQLLKYDNLGRPRKHILGHFKRPPVKKRPHNPTIECMCGCGGKFKKFDSSFRERKFISGHNGRLRK